jgi:CRP-like cAMP-binding protein/tRNA A-37 threonylcarbamoyl transferase component Bud32
MKRQNCWEYRQCGRQPEGKNIARLGPCPAASDTSYDGINSGKNGGRICWAVAGTFCDGKVQGTYAEKRESCMECPFFKLVQKDEGSGEFETKFLRFISQENKNAVFDNMEYRHVKAGERFVSQGEVEDKAFIIQHGSCLAVVEKDGEFHPVNHYGEGDIVGGLGILTGEPRRAHVDAETDMELWVLSKDQFEHISKKDPEILNFLTEIIADRFDSRRPTAYRTIGKYIATDIIGRGGYSIVYKGLHSALNMPVAIKMMRHNMAMDPEQMKIFRNEAQTIAGLKHENIVNVYDIEERYKTIFIIMELVEGESLETMLNHIKTIPFPLMVDYLVQICLGLDYAHKRGIIHRDINPTNMIVQREDRIKILDFGLACLVGTEDFRSAGTLYYASPEQVEGNVVDQRTDIYALGIMAYEMVTGVRPFPEDNLWELRKMHINEDISDPAKIVPDMPKDLRRFILKACQRDMNERYQDIDQILADLHPLIMRFGINVNKYKREERKITNIVLLYEKEKQFALSRLMDEFSAKAKDIGVVMKVADFHEE